MLAAGSAAPIVGTVAGGIIGGLIGSFAGATAGTSAAEVVLDQFIEDDANEMMKIVEEVFSKLAFNYLLNEKEANKAIEKILKKDVPELLKNMFASNNREKYATDRIENIIISIIEKRSRIALPTNQEIINNMGEVIDEIAG